MNTTTLFLFFVFTCIGVALGALIQRAQSRRSLPTEPPVPALPPVPTPASSEAAAPAPGAPAPAEAKPIPPVDVEVLRALRASSGALRLEMDGVRVTSRETLLPDQRRRLVNLLLELRPWLDNAPVPVPPAAEQPPANPAPPAPVKKDKAEKENAKPEVVLRSILQQIDDVLQQKLPSSPFNNRDIRLEEGPRGEVIVRDGLKKYEGIEAVPDPAIQALIRQAIADWEKGSPR